MKVLDRASVSDAIATLDILGILRAAFVGLAEGTCVQPPQTAAPLPSDAGDVIYYQAAMGGPAGVMGVTVSPFLTQLLSADLPPVTAYTLLLSAETGLPVLLCDSLPLIVARTGATTALAISALARPEDERLAIIGAGPIAESHGRFAQLVRPWQSVIVHSRTIMDPSSSERREAMAAAIAGVTFTDSLEEAVADADVIMACTSAETPVLDPRSLRAGTLVTSVTTDGPNAHEVPPVALPALDVYCDYRGASPLFAGEMVLARDEAGWTAESVLGDLPELLSGYVSPELGTDRVKFFRSIGLGIEDIAVASALL